MVLSAREPKATREWRFYEVIEMKLLERIDAKARNDSVRGHIDAISDGGVRGWAFEQGKSVPVAVRVTLAGAVLAEGIADSPRPDVEKALGVLSCGFELSSESLGRVRQDQIAKIAVEAVSSDGYRMILPKGRSVFRKSTKSVGYQSFDGQPGASNSSGKLRAIRLPNLAGKAFLDLGCNAGYFCGYALKSGADRVVGIESSAEYAAEAQRNFPEATILNQSWDKFPDGKFDVIILLSALHYEKEPVELLRRIHNSLTPDGVFILEHGVEMADEPYWVEVPRSVGVVKYPTSALLTTYLLKDFAVRCIGRSVDQAGDPLPRYVYHCKRREPNWVIITGEAGIGKSNLGYSLKREGVVTLQTDKLCFRQSTSKIKLADRDLDAYMRKQNPSDIRGWIDNVKTSELAGKLALFLFNSIPMECDVVVVEGYAFSNELIYSQFLDICKQRHVRIWRSEMAPG